MMSLVKQSLTPLHYTVESYNDQYVPLMYIGHKYGEEITTD